MDHYGFHDGNIYNLLESRCLDVCPDVDRSLQMHSSLIRRLSQERELEVEVGNPNVVWSASEDGTLRQHDFREGASCPPGGSYPHECRNILSGAKRSLTDPPKQALALKSCDVSTS